MLYEVITDRGIVNGYLSVTQDRLEGSPAFSGQLRNQEGQQCVSFLDRKDIHLGIVGVRPLVRTVVFQSIQALG